MATRTLPPGREAQYQAERDRILRAAYELFQRDGSKETSVHDVLRATGLSTRAFYRHFGSKDELVLEMYRVDCDRVTELVDAAVAAAPTPLAALEAWIDQSLAVVYDAPTWYNPWIWYGGSWIYRPYPYHRYWGEHYYRGGDRDRRDYRRR